MKKSILFGIWLFVSCLTACTDKTESGGSGGSSGGSSGYEGRPLPVVFLCTRIDQCFKWIIAFIRLRGDKWIRNVTRESAAS